MNPLNKQPTIFETLPARVIGCILDQLNQITGSKGIVNQADIPVAMRFARNLACTSKRMATNVNHPDATNIFLKSLSDKYGEPPEHFAALLNTIGARKWLWNYIKENGDDKAYLVIQDIYKLASDVLKEAKTAGLTFEYSEGCNGWPKPNPYYYQTKQGFVLYNDWAPSHLATPFGQIKIYGGGMSSGNSPLSAVEVFIRRLNAVFEHVAFGGSLGSSDKGKTYEITVFSGSDTIRKISPEEMKQISEEELASKRGTQNLIVNTQCGNGSIYKIRGVKGKEVPDVIWYDSRKSIRSYELINRIWEMLEANRLGKDPIPQQIQHKEAATKSDIEKPLFTNISEVSQWAIELATKLEQQPIFPGETWIRDETKLLVLERYRDARVIEILNAAASQFLEKGSEWIIHTFGCGNNRRSLNGKDLGDGIELWIYENHTPCDFATLKIAYDSVIKSISQNWIKSELKDHPAILHTKSEEDYVLFIKKENIIHEEDVLIRCLADQLSLSKSISCHSYWKDKSSSIMYLWIRKDSLEKTLEALFV